MFIVLIVITCIVKPLKKEKSKHPSHDLVYENVWKRMYQKDTFSDIYTNSRLNWLTKLLTNLSVLDAPCSTSEDSQQPALSLHTW